MRGRGMLTPYASIALLAASSEQFVSSLVCGYGDPVWPVRGLPVHRLILSFSFPFPFLPFPFLSFPSLSFHACPACLRPPPSNRTKMRLAPIRESCLVGFRCFSSVWLPVHACHWGHVSRRVGAGPLAMCARGDVGRKGGLCLIFGFAWLSVSPPALALWCCSIGQVI